MLLLNAKISGRFQCRPACGCSNFSYLKSWIPGIRGGRRSLTKHQNIPPSSIHTHVVTGPALTVYSERAGGDGDAGPVPSGVRAEEAGDGEEEAAHRRGPAAEVRSHVVRPGKTSSCSVWACSLLISHVTASDVVIRRAWCIDNTPDVSSRYPRGPRAHQWVTVASAIVPPVLPPSGGVSRASPPPSPAGGVLYVLSNQPEPPTGRTCILP